VLTQKRVGDILNNAIFRAPKNGNVISGNSYINDNEDGSKTKAIDLQIDVLAQQILTAGMNWWNNQTQTSKENVDSGVLKIS
jgi:hypothetical protein